jgi:hypothetical protein
MFAYNILPFSQQSSPLFVIFTLHVHFFPKARMDVNRNMVTVAVAFSGPDETIIKEFQSQVIDAIRIAISNGTFTKV